MVHANWLDAVPPSLLDCTEGDGWALPSGRPKKKRKCGEAEAAVCVRPKEAQLSSGRECDGECDLDRITRALELCIAIEGSVENPTSKQLVLHTDHLTALVRSGHLPPLAVSILCRCGHGVTM